MRLAAGSLPASEAEDLYHYLPEIREATVARLAEANDHRNQYRKAPQIFKTFRPTNGLENTPSVRANIQ